MNRKKEPSARRKRRFGERSVPKKRKDSKDPRFGLEFKEGTPPLGTSDHLDNPVIAIEVKSGGMAGKKSGPPPKSGPTPHGMKKGGIAKGCGKVMGDRRKVTKYY
jgi:hypothetical protein